MTERVSASQVDLPEPFILDQYFAPSKDRFLRLFRQQWDNAIPFSARDEITRFCVATRPGHATVLYSPGPPLTDGRSGCAEGRFWFSPIFQECGFTFVAAVVERMPDKCVCTLLAHELAHCYLAARSLEHLASGSAEAEVQELMVDSWGFSLSSLEEFEEQANAARTLTIAQLPHAMMRPS